ncbi:MAG: restriction endonuclease subunit S, partial [Nitrospiraceae bacterium]
IVAEIEGYQKVIDGARAVLDNYRPHIPIHPDWPMVELGDVCDIKTGKLNSNAAIEGGEYPFFTCSKDVFRINQYAFDCEAILLSGNNASGDFDVKYYHGKFNAYQRTYVITMKPECLDKMTYGVLRFVLNANLLDLKQKSIGGLTRYLTLGMITSIKLPAPPLATQQHIVAEIEAEQALVAANRELIARFEKKIQATLARVWGEDEPASGEVSDMPWPRTSQQS